MEIKLDNVSFKNLKSINTIFVEKEIISIIGNCKSGKYDLLRAISGREKIISGTITYGRKKVDCDSNIKKLETIKKDIFYIGADWSEILFSVSIKDDIKYYAEKYDNKVLLELLKDFELDESILKKCFLELSCSEIRKILLIIGLISDFKILIIDEPTLSLDYKSTQTLVKYLKKLKRENKIIIITSNNEEFLLEISDKILIIDNQKIIKEGTKYDVLSDKKLLDKADLSVPEILKFINAVKEMKKIKLNYRDNINDLIKDIYRYAR